MIYDMGKNDGELHWTIHLVNQEKKDIWISDFGVWISFEMCIRDRCKTERLDQSGKTGISGVCKLFHLIPDTVFLCGASDRHLYKI